MVEALRDKPHMRRFSVLNPQFQQAGQRLREAQQQLEKVRADRQQALDNAGPELANQLDTFDLAIPEAEATLAAAEKRYQELAKLADGAKRSKDSEVTYETNIFGQRERQTIASEVADLIQELHAAPGVADILARLAVLKEAEARIEFGRHAEGVEEALQRPSA
jgi:hypothetical protein